MMKELLNVFNQFGVTLYIYIVVIIWLFALSIVRFHWKCGICGKYNSTNLIKFVLQYCEHEGTWHL